MGHGVRGARAVAQIMGTAVGIDVRNRTVPARALEDAFDSLRAVDGRFSPYRPDSEVSRLIRGELDERRASADLREVLRLSEELRLLTNGYFDVRGHRRDGRPDPTGVVKGWSVERAARRLEAAGARDFTINAGGDIIARGFAEASRPWRVGIRHPRQADGVAAVLAVSDAAVATSGAYERGDHILDPHTRMPQLDLLSMTVVGPSLTHADGLATAAFAMGRAGICWIARQRGYGGLAITTDDQVIWTESIDRLLV